MDQFLDDLSKRLGARLQPELCTSTDFNSRVVWPVELASEPLFTFTVPPQGPPQGAAEMMPPQVRLDLTATVRQWVEGRARNAGAR